MNWKLNQVIKFAGGTWVCVTPLSLRHISRIPSPPFFLPFSDLPTVNTTIAHSEPFPNATDGIAFLLTKHRPKAPNTWRPTNTNRPNWFFYISAETTIKLGDDHDDYQPSVPILQDAHTNMRKINSRAKTIIFKRIDSNTKSLGCLKGQIQICYCFCIIIISWA